MATCNVYEELHQKEIYTDLWLEFIIFTPIIIILQLSLLTHTIRHEIKSRNNKVYQQLSIKSRFLYISLQIIGLWWVTSDSFRFVIDPPTHILRDNIGCKIVSYGPKMMPSIYYLCYLWQILLRLKLSFKDSYLALSKHSIRILYLLIFIPIISSVILFFIYNRHESTCLAKWDPMDFPSKHLDYCDYRMRPGFGQLIYSYVIGVWIPLINIVLGIIFSVKLNTLLSNQREDEQSKLEFKGIIVKMVILTLIGSISTAISYMLWFQGFLYVGSVFLWTDLFVNCVVIGLMFKYNEKYYKRCCRCFILLCFMRCDRGVDKVKEEDLMGYLEKDEDVIDLSEVLATPKSTITKSSIDEPGMELGAVCDMIHDVDNNQHVLEVQNSLDMVIEDGVNEVVLGHSVKSKTVEIQQEFDNDTHDSRDNTGDV